MKTIGNSQLVISVLFSGKSLSSGEISKIIMESEGKNIKAQDISSILSKISNPQKSNLGFFIFRKLKGRTFYYKMRKEALQLSEKQAYGLTVKTGSDNYTLEEVKEQFPDLAKYIKPGKKISKPRIRKSSSANVTKKTGSGEKVKAASSKISKSSLVDVSEETGSEKKVRTESSTTRKNPSVNVAEQAAPESDANTKTPKIAVEKNIKGAETISDAPAASVEQFALNTLLQKVLQKNSDPKPLDINVNITVKFDI